MIDWLVDNIGFFFGFIIVSLVSLVVVMAMKSDDRHNRLMSECMKDRKEYECYSMLKSNSNTTIIPVVTPMRVGK